VRVAWTPPAEADLDEMVRYVAQDSLRAALAQEARIHDAVSRLAVHPELGRIGRSGTRELVVVGTRYVVIYRASGDTLEVMRVLHGARDRQGGGDGR
jgi:toxin ParE1/3/4